MNRMPRADDPARRRPRSPANSPGGTPRRPSQVAAARPSAGR